jgi:hypothetical protein
MRKLISKEVVYDKETSIDSVKNILHLPYTIFGTIRTVIYKNTYIKRGLFSKKESTKIVYKIEQWVPSIHGPVLPNYTRDKAEDYLQELAQKAKFDAETQIKKYEYE